MRYIFPFLLWWAVNAEALPIKRVNIIAVNGTAQSSDSEILDAFKTERSYARKSGIRLVLNKFIRIDDPSLRLQNLESRILRLSDYVKFVRMNGLHRGGVYTIFATPLLPDSGKLYWAGVARDICTRGGSSVAWATIGNIPSSLGVDGKLLSQTAFSHELEHLLGAYHDEDGATLMHPNALIFVVNSLLPLSEKSRKEVKNCLNRK